jgi:alpha-tubulin suppressor-like RCC1 family protein
VQIASGRAHVCGVNRYGIARCWGDDKLGQLGDNAVARADRPVRVLNVNDATWLTAGTDHTCELERDGTVRCWGDNARGQLGDGTIAPRGRAGVVQGLAQVTDLNASGRRTCARTEAGEVWCWGERTRDATGCAPGPSNTVCNTRPVKVDALQGSQHAMPIGLLDCGWSDGGPLRCVPRA